MEIWCSIDFNFVPLIYSANSPINATEDVASVADRITGNLLLYTDGANVWNRNNVIMPTGTGFFSRDLISSINSAV